MNSEGIKNEVYVNDIYKLKGYSFQRLPKYVVDIGANVGWFSKLAAERFPKTNILAYELIEDNYKQCVKLNKPHSNVRVYNKAIIGNNSVKSVFLHPTNIGGHKPLFDGDSSYISEERFKETFRHHNKKDYDNREDLDIPSQISVKDIIEEIDSTLSDVGLAKLIEKLIYRYDKVASKKMTEIENNFAYQLEQNQKLIDQAKWLKEEVRRLEEERLNAK